ncbi:PLC-like phosphodiesterase [Triangularia verruculosa]|uniref:PLC-like phosphodiesterase n=1 Tax=Triangularia verruculosa TaxID=2587418 RepID=A0AAN7AZ79_9PEZI|nr:PLC-like phosphodiesterase [Triangularia verruculosa]
MVNLLWTTTCLLLSCSTAVTASALPDPLADADDRSPRPKARIPPPLSVGDYALQKVLSDAEDIFGYYDYPPDPKKKSRINMSRCEWMSNLPDDAPLHQLNIPGAHASATWSYTNTTTHHSILPTSHIQCQTSSLIDSLNAGIRFFDLTFGINPLTGKSLLLYHNAALLSYHATLESVLFGFYTWLSAHPSEALFLSLQYFHPHQISSALNINPPHQSKIDQLIYNLITSRPAKRYIHQSKTLPLSLGSCRGKIILLRRFDLPHITTNSHLPGIHLSPLHYPPFTSSQSPFTLTYGSRYNKHHQHQTLHISDWHDLSSSSSPLRSPESHISAKLTVVASHLSQAAKGHGPEAVKSDNELWITFASGQNILNKPVPITPELLALGSEDTTTTKAGVNKGVCKILRQLKNKRLGIVVVDFWEGEHGDLIGAILGDWGNNGRYGGREGEYC